MAPRRRFAFPPSPDTIPPSTDITLVVPLWFADSLFFTGPNTSKNIPVRMLRFLAEFFSENLGETINQVEAWQVMLGKMGQADLKRSQDDYIKVLRAFYQAWQRLDTFISREV